MNELRAIIPSRSTAIATCVSSAHGTARSAGCFAETMRGARGLGSRANPRFACTTFHRGNPNVCARRTARKSGAVNSDGRQFPRFDGALRGDCGRQQRSGWGGGETLPCVPPGGGFSPGGGSWRVRWITPANISTTHSDDRKQRVRSIPAKGGRTSGWQGPDETFRIGLRIGELGARRDVRGVFFCILLRSTLLVVSGAT